MVHVDIKLFLLMGDMSVCAVLILKVDGAPADLLSVKQECSFSWRSKSTTITSLVILINQLDKILAFILVINFCIPLEPCRSILVDFHLE